ncbi:MAG: methyltransferase domain-containing protein [Candidatus Nanoarchaeia archaeon]
MRLFWLSGGQIGLAREEITALAGGSYKQDSSVLLTGGSFELTRLAFTKKAYEFLFSCSRSDLRNTVKKFDWKSAYNESFSVRVHRASGEIKKDRITEQDIAAVIWDAVSDPDVDLRNAKTKIEIILTEKNAYCGILVFNNKEKFEARKTHHLPGKQPTSMDPRLARACVNLTGIREGKILDPFCGAGGILVEAGLMGFSVEGYDIDESVLEKCKQNFEHFGIKKYKLAIKDATTIKDKVEYVVADLPYGRGSALSDERERLYVNFLTTLAKILMKRAVIVFPDYVDHKKIIENANAKIKKAKNDKKTEMNKTNNKMTRLTIKNEFLVYIHKNLSRRIIVL